MRSLATELTSFSILSFYQVYGIFYATSFLDLYRNPKSLTTSLHNKTVIVSRDEQYLFLVSFLCQRAQEGFHFLRMSSFLESQLRARTWAAGGMDSRIRVCDGRIVPLLDKHQVPA